MTTLRIDLETYSSVDLRKCGVHKYAESDDFEVMLFGYAFDDEPVQVIDLALGQTIPVRVIEAMSDPAVTKTAYNAAFELACLRMHFGVALDAEQWRCTSVHALYLGLPGNLADVGRVIGLPEEAQKFKSGWSLIRYFCLPCKPTKTNGGRTRNLPHHDPAKWQLFKDYCAQDVRTERFIAHRIAKFPVLAKEWRLWALDQKMNSRGIKMDRELIEAAIECDTIYKKRLTDEAIALTGLSNPNSRNQLLEWLQEETDDSELVDLTKKSVPKLVERLIAEEEKDEEKNFAIAKRVLELRSELAKSSVSKYHAMARAICRDDRIRGLLQFYGANRTGRWAGRLVQVQNLPQNKLKDLDLARELLKARKFDTLEMMFGNVPDTLSQLIRTAFVAGEGKRFIVVDFSAIEARVIAWMGWCQWRLDVFATHGKIYEASAEKMFKLPPGSVDKKSPHRQKGKIAELALGYQGGAGALITMGALGMGLEEDELDPIKVAWREANPEIVELWYAAERCAIRAVREKTRVVMPIAKGRTAIVFAYESGFLFIELPSSRRLAYVKPTLEMDEKFGREGLTYEGLDQKTKQWTRLKTYGGKLIENITQAIARDCLREAMLELDNVGYEQLMTVHDEDVIEEDIGVGSLSDVERVMGLPIPWAPDLLLRGDGFETSYYRKDD